MKARTIAQLTEAFRKDCPGLTDKQYQTATNYFCLARNEVTLEKAARIIENQSKQTNEEVPQPGE